jgi:hypothetical protein
MLIEFMTSKFFFIVPMFVGGLAFWGLAKFASFGTGITKKDTTKEILEDGNVALALYLGLRVVAIGIAVGLFVVAGTSV